MLTPQMVDGIPAGYTTSKSSSLGGVMHTSLLTRMAEQKELVLQLIRELGEAGTSEDQIRLRQRLQQESNTLARMVHGYRRRLLRGPGRMAVQEVSPEQAQARMTIVAQRSQVLNKELVQVVKAWREQKGNPLVRRNLQLKYQLLVTERVHLQRRMTLLRQGRDYVLPRRLAPHQIRVARKMLRLPSVLPTPTVDETAALVGLLASRIQRRPEDTDATFRERLVAYLRRALVRWSNRKAARTPDDEAVVGAVAETLTEDQEALEAEAQAGGAAADPVSDVFGPLVESEPVQEQVDAAIDNIQPSVVQAADPGEVVVQAEAILLDAEAGANSNLGLSTVDTLPVDVSVTTQAVDLSVLAPSPEAAYYPGTTTTQAPLPTIQATTSKPPRRQRSRRGGVSVPRVPTFSKASGTTKATPSASTTLPTVAATSELAPVESAEEMVVPQAVEAESTVAPEAPKDNKMLWIGVGVAVLVGGYLLTRRS